MVEDNLKLTIDSYNQNAKGYADYYFGRNVMGKSIEKFISLLPHTGFILDAGCGPGQDSYFFYSKGYNVIGIDLSENMIQEARKRGSGVEFIQRDMREDWFKMHSSFMGVWCCASLLHLNSNDANIVLLNFYNLLAPKGILFLSVIQGKGEILRTEKRPFGTLSRYMKLYEIDEFVGLLSRSNFSVLEVKDNGFWLSCYAKRI